ncbi:MAG: hypothetical protein IJI60_03840 [Bacilli bacterium]|nr:hypothetical protein [Bacilli bacterium]
MSYTMDTSNTGRFIIDNTKLISASKTYTDASDEFAATVEEFKAAVENIDWKDATGQEMKEILTSAIPNFETAKTNLQSNSKMFKDIGTTAGNFAAEISGNVRNLDLKN